MSIVVFGGDCLGNIEKKFIFNWSDGLAAYNRSEAFYKK